MNVFRKALWLVIVLFVATKVSQIIIPLVGHGPTNSLRSMSGGHNSTFLSEHSPEVESAPKEQTIFWHKGKKYIYLDQKWYLASEKNVYDVKGVPTLYIDNGKVVESPGKVSVEVGDQAVEELNKLLAMSPTDAYSKEGVEQLLRSIRATKASLAKKNDALKALGQ